MQRTSATSSRTIAFIFARGGSKGVPHKNLAEVAGRSLIARSVDVARASPRIDRVIVSTDDSALAEAARDAGAEVPFVRPAELASDTVSELLAWKHAIQFVRDAGDDFDRMISLPPTAPLRTVADVDAALAKFDPSTTDLQVCVTEARANPYFTMVTVDETGLIHPVVRGDTRPQRRQDAPEVFEITSVAFVTTPQYVLDSPDLYAGRVGSLVIPPERAVDIDTPMDLEFARFLATRPID